jgi:hypothetical protein
VEYELNAQRLEAAIEERAHLLEGASVKQG